ncbi:MAG: anti-sigma factor [Devosia sp.]|uniref:anti-sigma factor family protein n=1 Tax=Devosia sp. TaxID=1871048 RepID=UPI0024CA275D|nr:anti-sigma factor [Devosia sp.]UYN98321.1 MAG: anti-sigma factor [Devosia sp.]
MSEITRDQLMAYADGQLEPAQRSAVEAHCASNAEAAAELAALMRQSDAIRTLFAPAAAEQVPVRLDPHRLASAARRRQGQFWARAAMILIVLGMGVAMGWLLRPGPAGPALHERLIANAVSAHTVYVAENRHAVEVASTDSDHLSSWLSNRLDTGLAMPDLSAEGLTFLGGRLLPAPDVPGGRAAQLMYENPSGERLTLYITPATGIDGPDYETVPFGADNALYWASDVITCTIVGPQPPEALAGIANAVFSQLTPSQSDQPAYRG